ncbi:BRCT domain-containing protein [Deltaproteobacteria bacterium TL4]
MNRIQELEHLITSYNQNYRSGEDEETITDAEFDALVDELQLIAPNSQVLIQVGITLEPSDSRKETLPHAMGSLNKIKTGEELSKWMKAKAIDPETVVCLTPKYDGLAFLGHHTPEGIEGWTRGNGQVGQRSDEWIQGVTQKEKFTTQEAFYCVGEVIMPKSTFAQKYETQFKNPRNFVAGLFNAKEPDAEKLKDVVYLRYGMICEKNKSEQIQFLNQQLNSVEVPFRRYPLSQITQAFLESLFEEWSRGDFEMDGIVIEIDDYALQSDLGQETSSFNPAYARAWKGVQGDVGITTIQDIEYQVSKEGRIVPVGLVDPIDIGGVTVSRVTLNNVEMMHAMGCGINAKVEIIRSGDVIPKIVAVLEKVAPVLPTHCPSCRSALNWDKNHIHLLCPAPHCPEKGIQKFVFYFKTLGVEETSERTLRQLYLEGWNTLEKIYAITKEDLLKLEGWKEKKSTKFLSEIHNRSKNVELSKVQHALSLFPSLGQKKLVLLQDYDTPEKIPSRDDLLAIDGYSEILADAYLDNIKIFWETLPTLPVTLKKSEVNREGKFRNQAICFTGFRNKDWEALITAEGGSVVSSVSKKTSLVVCKDPSVASAKLKKAQDLDIPVLSLKEFEESYLQGN